MDILVIEDISFSRKLIENQLKSLRHSVISVSGGYEALEVLDSSQTVNLVVCDLYLADMTGFQIFQECEKLYNARGNDQLGPPFILLTSSKNQRDLDDAESMGFVAALSKPLDLQNLQEIINSLDSEHALIRQNQAKGKILLADAEGVISKLMQNIMEGSGYTFLFSQTGQECLSSLAEYRNIKLIVSELELPDTNALKLLAKARVAQEEAGKPMPPFVLMTEKQNSDLIQAAQMANFADIVLPPLEKYAVKQKMIQQLFKGEDTIKSKHRTILLIDDIHFHCVMTRVALHQSPVVQDGKYEIITVDSGEAAINHLKTDPSICLVISDYFLPDMTGIEIYQKLRHIFEKNSQLGGITASLPPFVLVTTSEDEVIHYKAVREGFRKVFTKPLDTKQFLTAINELLENDRQGDVRAEVSSSS
jgi:CheY-like chemotaxis protein